MSEKERLQLENELSMTCSKAQAINKYIDELEESSKLSELWCKSQQENQQLKENFKTLKELQMKTNEENQQLKEEINKISKKEIKAIEMLYSIEYGTLTRERIMQIEEVLFEIGSENNE